MDLSQFYDVFFEESYELLDNIEHILLGADINSFSDEILNTIFRCAHSIKGSSATFGFQNIAHFTHIIENYLDLVRKKERSLTKESVDLILKSVDCLKSMIGALQSNTTIEEAVHESLVTEFQNLIESQDAPILSPKAEDVPADAPPKEEMAVKPESAVETPELYHWKIHFRPNIDIFKSGYDITKILKNLAEWGEVNPSLNAIQFPESKDFDPKECYLSWDLDLRTSKTEEFIRKEVFEWVEVDSILEFTALALPEHTSPGETESDDKAALPVAQPVQKDESPVQESPPIKVLSSNEEKPAAQMTPAAKLEPNLTPSKTAEQVVQVQAAATQTNKKEAVSIRVPTEKVDSLINIVGELIITQSILAETCDNLDDGRFGKLKEGLNKLEQHCRELQENVMRIRMLPISNIFNRYQRLVRDMATALGKNIELKISGENTELDKTVLEKISDPLVHLIRNALDHGIEMPEKRMKLGKSPAGQLFLNASHQGGHIVIQIGDDGAGLNTNRIKEKGIERGLYNQADNWTDEQINQLIFSPGFSTAEKITDMSGRGVGMDVVKQNIEALSGHVDVQTTPGQGSVFTIILPLTLAILEGQLVRVRSQAYIFPLMGMKETIEIDPTMVKQLNHGVTVYHLRSDYVPMIDLASLFNLKAVEHDLETFLLIVEVDKKPFGVVINELLQQQQIVIKSLENNYRKVSGVAGATILGDGSVALILDPAEIVRMNEEKYAIIKSSEQTAAT